MINGRVSPDGALFALDELAPPDTTCMGGQALTPAGVAYVANNILAAPPYYFPNGFKTDANGTLIIGPGPIIGYKGGYPYNANDELVVQLNQPVSPGDAWVAGIRVGPLGGVYIIDVVPPTLGGFSNGFSNGFEVYDGPPIHIFSPADLFLNGEQGAWYDPSDLTTMFQDRAGSTSVTADGQTVGKILDKSKGLALGPELVIDGSPFVLGSWSYTAGSVTVTSGEVVFSAAANDNAAYQANTVIGNQVYEATIVISSISSGGIFVRLGTSNYADSPIYTSPGTYTVKICAHSTPNNFFQIINVGVTSAVISSLSIKLVSGNHSTAPSDAARPLKTSTSAADWINYDAVDDVLNTTFASSLGTDCTVARANVGAGPTILTAQTIGTSYADSTDNAGLVIVNRALTGPETTELTAWLTAKGATA